MDNNIVYCDHMYDILDVSDDVIAEDAQLDKMNSFPLTKEDYVGENDVVSEFLDKNESYDLYQYSCPYCESLGRPSIVAFIINLDSEHHFIRLRKVNKKWKWDKIESPFNGKDIRGYQGYVIAYI